MEDTHIDPILGRELAYYPVARWRLLLRGGVAYTFGYLVLMLAFANVDDLTAAPYVIGGLALWALPIGWYVLHFWNREVTLYEQGFSYRLGSQVAFIRYEDVARYYQRAERVRYFGLIPYTVHRYTVHTVLDEVITLGNIYYRVGELALKLEAAIMAALRPKVHEALSRGEQVAFHERLFLDNDGLHSEGRTLLWADYRGYRTERRQLCIDAATQQGWFCAPLAEIANLLLLVELLRQYHEQLTP